MDPGCLTQRDRYHPILQTELEPEGFVATGTPVAEVEEAKVEVEEAPKDVMPEGRLFQKRTTDYAYRMPVMIAGMGDGFERN